ncbi:MAG: phosphoribosyltransferase family protein [Pyrinomonadaceae bacterium]
MNEQPLELHSAAEIAVRVKSLAGEILSETGPHELTVLGVLEDGFVFLSDLLRELKAPLRTTFLRYDHRSLGGFQDLSFTTPVDIKGRDCLLVEGVLDTGVPQEYLIRQLEERGASRVRLCVLVDKPDRRRTQVEVRWRAFESHDDYIVGYGLGFQERWRELPFLGALRREQGAG